MDGGDSDTQNYQITKLVILDVTTVYSIIEQ